MPAAGLASSSSDSAPATAAGHSHGLSKGAIAGIVIGSLAGAALLMTLAAFVIIKVPAAVLLLLCASLLTMTNSAGLHSGGMHLFGIVMLPHCAACLLAIVSVCNNGVSHCSVRLGLHRGA